MSSHRARSLARERSIHVIGLTGGIACGKSTVADLLRERGFPVVDADCLARRVVEPGQPALARIVETFGPEVLQEDGRLNRRALGDRVFADPEKRRALERITHPAIALASQQEFARLRSEGHEMGFYEATLLVEAGTWRAFSALVVVSAPADLQRARLLERDPDLSEEDAARRIASQMPLEEKERVAHHVIHNDSTVADLQPKVDAMIEALRGRLSG